MSKSVLTPEVREILSQSRIDGNNLHLPPGNLERSLYMAVDKHIKNCGGKWNKSAKAHVFAANPAEKLGLVLESGHSVDDKKLRQAYYSPAKVADQVARLAGVEGHTVLEPSAGNGMLADACMAAGAAKVDCIELDEKEAEGLRGRYECICGDFLTIYNDPKDEGAEFKYSRILQNPPFTKNQGIKHVLHALENWLAPGGRLCAILPDKEFPQLDKYDPVEYKLPEGSFKESGAGVRTKLIVINLF